MPLQREQIGGHSLWVPVCDRCREKGAPLPGYDESRDIPELDLDLDDLVIVCDTCDTSSAPQRTFDARDAILDFLRTLPGGQDLDLRPGSMVRTMVDLLAQGGTQEELEGRLLELPPNFILELEEDAVSHSAFGALRQALTGRGALARSVLTPPQQTSVRMSREVYDLPAWVVEGVWVQRVSDGTKAKVDKIGPLTVVLAVANSSVTWRRIKNAKFETDFVQAPPPPSRWQRLIADVSVTTETSTD